MGRDDERMNISLLKDFFDSLFYFLNKFGKFSDELFNLSRLLENLRGDLRLFSFICFRCEGQILFRGIEG